MANDDKNKKNKGNKPFDPTDSNPDPITKQPGAHPIGTGIGASGAGAMGAVVGGMVGGPVGAVVGAAIGAVGGGLMGKGAAEAINPTVEDTYWRDNYNSRPYVESGRTYEDYQPAYRTGYEGYGRYAGTGRTYDEVEPELRSDYEKQHSGAGLGWEKAKHAARDAWDKVENALPGDHDRDRSTSATSTTNVSGRDAANVKLYEERVIADKHREKAGEVSLGKHVETEKTNVSVPIEKERIVIEEVNTTGRGTAIDPGAANFASGEVAHMEVYEEVPDIRKEAFVREEVNLRKEVDRDVVSADEEIRREELDIDTQGRPVVRRTDDPRNSL